MVFGLNPLEVWTDLDVFAVSREVHLDHKARDVLAVTDSVKR